MHELSFRKDILPLKDKLFRLAFRITQSRQEAEDVVQETMMRVWCKREEWGLLGSLEAYCLTVAKNLSVDRKERMDARTVDLSVEIDCVSGGSNPYDRLVSKDHLTVVKHLVDELPEKQRLMMHLREVEGKSYKEIASLMKVSEEQVKVNLFRARQKVKQQFLEIDKYGV
ncbi:RNA polymerase ECF-type sigma factor [gut metagenome]|uniref:RNA polymerase ECF-type sigma factor n=1 Tax=gut metagenome TaxID=749906 RepID=J9G0H1_9ZZZZ